LATKGNDIPVTRTAQKRPDFRTPSHSGALCIPFYARGSMIGQPPILGVNPRA